MTRRLIFVNPLPVARIFAVMYAGFGFLGFLLFSVSDARYFILPFGLLGPIFHLNLNFNIGRPDYPFSYAFWCLVVVLSYAVTGWLTGIVMVLCFNFIAKRIGGIDEEYFSFQNDEDHTEMSSRKNEANIQEGIHQSGAGTRGSII